MARLNLIVLLLALGACTGRSAPAPEPVVPEPTANDGSGPTPGRVHEGVAPEDSQTQTRLDRIEAWWGGFFDPNGIEDYEWAIGRTPGGTEVQDWVSVGLAQSAVKQGVILEVGVRYYVAMRARDTLGNLGAMAVSNGVVMERVLAQGPGGATGSFNPAGGTSGVSQSGSPQTLGGGPVVPEHTGGSQNGGGSGGNNGNNGGNSGGGVQASSITRHGVTWTFDTVHEVGQFVNGDWWVRGPVNIVSIFPASQRVGGRVMHGTMIDPDPSVRDQAYDSTMYASNSASFFDSQANVGLDVSAAQPLHVPASRSIVSAVSAAAGGSLPQLQTAVVLTVLGERAPADAFRPPYAGTDKALHWRESQLDPSRLLSLAPMGTPPTFAEAEAWFERIWLDHAHGWLGRYMHPSQNMPDYGREMSDRVGRAALLLHTNASLAQKRELLVRFVQLGIDLYGIAAHGGRWPSDGGHSSGRKFPILFAGAVLGDPRFAAVTRQGHVRFGEDGQTFYVAQTSPGVYNFGFGGYTAADVGMPEWGFQHDSNPAADRRSWTADNYRVCCTANCWVGWILAARMMGLQQEWAHDALFDYQDRYMGIEAPGTWTRSWSRFAEAMWDGYRSNF